MPSSTARHMPAPPKAHDAPPRADACAMTAAAEDVYRRAIAALRGAGVPFLVGGTYAVRHFCRIQRATKDLDVFLARADVDAALAALRRGGFRTDVPFTHWLAKGHFGDDFVDLIFNAGNGVAPVDKTWFEDAPETELLGLPVKICRVEETIWSKAFVMERERFDGADVLHLLAANGASLDWGRLVARFGEHWRVLFAHLVLFPYVYPAERDAIPSAVVDALAARLRAEAHGMIGGDPTPIEGEPGLCRGTLLSREQYLVDLARGYRDARLVPEGAMSEAEVAVWTAAIWNAKH